MLQISLVAKDKDVELIEQILFSCGALSISYQDAAGQPILEPLPGENPLWSTIKISALFESTKNVDEIRSRLDQLPTPNTDLVVEVVKEQNWVRRGIKDFKAMQFGNRLWVCPSWSQISRKDAVVVNLDPGLAFGTGTHPTTALCLQWLDANPPENAVVIDYGCGSGVLVIAAVKLGAQRGWAVDIDPQALWSTRKNIEKNNLPPEIIDSVTPECLPKLQTDILIANILSGPLIELSSTLAHLIKPGGKIILSGILVEQAESVVSHYSNYCKMVGSHVLEGWALLEGRRNY